MAGDPTRTLDDRGGEPRPGEIVAGKYRLAREVGRGGMGVVFEAEDLTLGRPVALKFLPRGLVADPEARERFVGEARAASALDHPGICTVHEIGETASGGLYIAMALCRGGSLKDRLARGPLPPAEAVDVALQLADGLACAHRAGLVHRDVKPANVALAPDGRVKLLDFGLAKLAGAAGRTAPGTPLGTVSYMSPEQARGDPVDARSDVWSLGVVVYEMIAGGLPFGSEREAAVLHAIRHERPRPVRRTGPGVPPALERIVAKALEKDPARRYPSAAELADDLRTLSERLTAARAARPRGWRFRRSRKPFAIGAAAASLALVAAAVWLLDRPGLAFQGRDKIMVADAENLTGEKVFDLALRTAIEASLQQSPYAAVFDRPQIADTLRLMRADPSGRVGEALACDVCRFAGVRAFVQPRILAVGDAFELEAVVVDPVRRRHVDRVRVTARGREAVLLEGIDRLTKRLRSRLGESVRSVEAAGRPVASVTTSSWEALDYFSVAQKRREEGKFREAVSLYELALAKDPRFVAARGSLGLVLIQFVPGRGADGREMLRRAVRDAVEQTLPDRDLLPLKAVVRQYVDGDLDGALAEYRTALALFPDLMAPPNNAGRVLQALGRVEEAEAMYEEAARRAPRSSIPLMNLWLLHLNARRDGAAAERVARRMVALAPEIAGYRSALGYSLAVQERFAEAETELRKTVAIEPDHPYAVANLAHVLFAAGRPAEAVPFYRRTLELSKAKRASGNLEGDGIALALALRDAGKPEEAAAVANETRDSISAGLGTRAPGVGDWLAFGMLAETAGDRARAESCLRKALAAGAPKGAPELMALAGFYALLGRTERALRTLEAALAAGYPDPTFPIIVPEFRELRNDPRFRKILGRPAS